jgi:serine/threonine protein kinase
LLEEARLLSRVRHSNVVALLDVLDDEEGRVFLVLELVRGLNLSSLTARMRRRGGQLTSNCIASVGVALCRALAAAQRAGLGGLIHRDVTPQNVLLSTEGEIKLADFGIARALDRESWTEVGLVKGKACYVSPEQVRGERLDVRSDLFAVGVVLFELLAGSRPFLGAGRTSVLRAVAAGERPPLRDVAPAVPGGLASAVEQLLHPDREQRPISSDHAARLLAGFAREQMAADELGRLVRGLRRGEVGPARGKQPRPASGERYRPIVVAAVARPDCG